jgi:OPA family glycerol-3-phosphate transporter-like MFS transporter
MNLSLAIPDILREFPQYTKAQLGMAMTALSLAYGLSKFLMGSVSDRSNPRWFMPLGLLLSAGVTASFGLFKGIYASLALIIVLQALNGWFNGMGWPASGKTMVHWFSLNERGKVVAFWNTAHNVGGGLVAALAVVGVGFFGDWGAKFYFNALVAALVAVLVLVLLRDTPVNCGLPPIEEFRNDRPANYSAASERTLSFREIFFAYVLNNRLLWAIAVANAFVYFVRYGVQNWIPTYLETAKGFSFNHASAAWFMFEYAAIPGTILCGWMSDRVFRGHRGPATILFMGLTLLGLVVYGLNRNGPLWIDMASLIMIGFFVYGPIMMIGLHALELVPKKAAGTAAGFTGFFGYAFGSAIAGAGVGWIADHYGWGGVFATMIACCVMAMAFVALTLRHGPARLA